MTKEFVKEVMSIPSCSGKEAMLREYIERFSDERGVSHRRDGKGNLYLTKGESDGCYPCLANHMDTVQSWQGAFADRRAAAKSLQSCLTLCDPIDGSPPGSTSLGF